MKSLTQIYEIHAPIADVWVALVDPKMINHWGGGPAKMDAKTGTKFSLWGGDIHGTNTKVIPQKLLEQDWYGGDWEKPSKVIFRLASGSSGKTNVTLTQTDIPDGEFVDIEEGWKRFYMGPLKKLVEKK